MTGDSMHHVLMCSVWKTLLFGPTVHVTFIKGLDFLVREVVLASWQSRCSGFGFRSRVTFLNFLKLFAQLSRVFLMWKLGWQTIDCSWITVKQKWFWLLQRSFSFLTLFLCPSVWMAATSSFLTQFATVVSLLLHPFQHSSRPWCLSCFIFLFPAANLLCLSHMPAGASPDQCSKHATISQKMSPKTVVIVCCLEIRLL